MSHEEQTQASPSLITGITHSRNDKQPCTMVDEQKDKNTSSHDPQPKNIDLENEKQELQQRQQVQAKYCNRTARDLPSLAEGNVVRMKPFKLGEKSCPKAKVTARLNERSYTVETEDGAGYRRNQHHLRNTSEPPTQPIIPEQPTDVSRTPSTSGEPMEEAQSSAVPQQSPVPPVTNTPNGNQRPQCIRRSPEYLKDYIRDQLPDFV